MQNTRPNQSTCEQERAGSTALSRQKNAKTLEQEVFLHCPEGALALSSSEQGARSHRRACKTARVPKDSSAGHDKEPKVETEEDDQPGESRFENLYTYLRS